MSLISDSNFNFLTPEMNISFLSVDHKRSFEEMNCRSVIQTSIAMLQRIYKSYSHTLRTTHQEADLFAVNIDFIFCFISACVHDILHVSK